MDFNKIVDENEHFLGTKLNAEKKNRLNSLFAVCDAIGKLDHGIIFEAMPFTERSRNGMAILRIPCLGFYPDGPARAYIAKALELADDFGTSVAENKIILSFGIRDMWDEWAYTNDDEHKGEYVGHLKIVK